MLPVLATVALSACASKPQGFTKVKIYRLNPDAKIVSVDPSIPFEQRHLLYGAVTNEEREARRGNYYTFFWNAQDATQPAKLRFQYLQSTTGFQKKQLIVDIEKVSNSNVTKVQITGPDFARDGKVLAWCATLIQGGKEIAQEKSALWE